MKKRIIMLALATACLMLLLALGVNAAATNEFGTVETSTTIDLTGMSTDTKARVVLFDGTEYHTYPAQYIVKSATDIAFDFAKINTAFSKSYANNSVIRIEIPNTVRVIVSGLFNYGKNNNLKEVYFPSDSQVYKFNWGCFEQNTGLEKINIPASLTEYHGSNHFAKCSSLKYVTFDERYNVSTIPNNFFQSCSSLEEIVFPNSVTQIGGGAFSTCSKLKKVVFGANAQVMLPSASDSATGGLTWYIPATFYGANVETEPESNMIHHEGKNNNGVSGNQHGPKNVTFVYTGTYEEALALRARCKAADLKNGEKCIGLKRIYDAVLCTEAEYFELTGKRVGEGSIGSYFIYGYSACEAFYNGNHTIDTEKSNDCVELCATCQKVTIEHIATENMSTSVAYADFGKPGTKTTKCLNIGCSLYVSPVLEEMPALFTRLGYSASEKGRGGIAIGFTVNNAAITEYEEITGKAVKYGVFVATKERLGNNDVFAKDGTVADGVINAEIKNYEFVVFEIKIVGITDAQKDVKLAMGAYVEVTDGEATEYSYMQSGTLNENEKYCFISYNDIVGKPSV